MQKIIHYKMIAVNHKAANCKMHDWLRLQLKCCRENAENALLELNMNNWKRLTETDLSSSSCGRRQHTAVELSVEASKQTTDAPHTDSHRAETTREAELEI